MKARIVVSGLVVTLAFGLWSSVGRAELAKDKQAPLPEARARCLKQCDVKMKECIDADKVPDQTCVGTREICYGVCNDANPAPQ